MLGLFNISGISGGLPIELSMPYFLDADPALAARYLRERTGARTAIGEKVVQDDEEDPYGWRIASAVVGALMVLLPVGLILKQPNLGTAALILGTGGAVMWCAGVHWAYFATVFGAVGGAVYAVAVWLTRRSGIDLPRRVALLFYLLVLLFLREPLTRDYVNLPVDFLRTLPPWSHLTRDHAAHNDEMNDLTLQIVPWAHQARESWRSLEAPLWNHLSGAGYPLLANAQSAALSPLPIALAQIFRLDRGRRGLAIAIHLGGARGEMRMLLEVGVRSPVPIPSRVKQHGAPSHLAR